MSSLFSDPIIRQLLVTSDQEEEDLKLYSLLFPNDPLMQFLLLEADYDDYNFRPIDPYDEDNWFGLPPLPKKRKRDPVIQRQRKNDWDRVFEILLAEGQFEQHFRMSKCSMENLVQTLGDDLKVVAHKSTCRTSLRPITPDEMLMMTISYLSGGGYRDRVCYGVSVDNYYSCIYKTMDAILKHFKFVFPETEDDMDCAAAAFAAHSDEGTIMKGCIGCIDGWFVKTDTPTENQVNLRTNFYSGRYKSYGRRFVSFRFVVLCCVLFVAL
jgi:hypothetical protein